MKNSLKVNSSKSNRIKKAGIWILSCIVICNVAKAQLIVDTALSGSELIEHFFDTTNIEVFNVVFTGIDSAVGSFDAVNTNLGLSKGILLTSGAARLAIGPNDKEDAGADNGMAGDIDLTNYCGQPTFNAAIIEFDFVPITDTFFFQFVFGSEEYMEFVGGSFNDDFIMLLNGPGYNDSNLAHIPGVPYPITVSNINCTIGNHNYYKCNDPENTECSESFSCPDSAETTIQYDGLTVPMDAHAIVTPGDTFHLKIAVADAGDASLDAGVFISIENLGYQNPLSNFEVGDDHFSIYPNPAPDFIMVKASSEGKIWIDDLNGRCFLSNSISGQERLDLRSLPSGAFVLTYQSNDCVLHRSFVKL